MALLLNKQEEIYYTYRLNSVEREFLVTLLYGMKNVLKDDESYSEMLKDLIKVFAED